ncbi:MAG: non-canonical purine NTP diphosphatase [Bacteroidales bacterium]|nr:non-canonical purine NTP diphosphatase [Bacteroidales bacterium]HOY39342.1 non-canonical purine NTP diphosphatase [Bacteroidales bacterium]HQP02986.1 non-canonical purine NTP diphosphatase [Bacteroidales bacterium]
MELIFATNNPHKLREVSEMLPPHIIIKSLADIQCFEDIPETGSTLSENAVQKAKYVSDKYHYDCFADDTGLEVEALNMQPGVFSARYAGNQKNPADNIEKLLLQMQGVTNRKARFRTVIALSLQGKILLFEGTVNGSIIHTLKGEKGFGYDPVFVPDGYTHSFAEMSPQTKNKISHRALAFEKLIGFLSTF